MKLLKVKKGNSSSSSEDRKKTYTSTEKKKEETAEKLTNDSGHNFTDIYHYWKSSHDHQAPPPSLFNSN